MSYNVTILPTFITKVTWDVGCTFSFNLGLMLYLVQVTLMHSLSWNIIFLPYTILSLFYQNLIDLNLWLLYLKILYDRIPKEFGWYYQVIIKINK